MTREEHSMNTFCAAVPKGLPPTAVITSLLPMALSSVLAQWNDSPVRPIRIEDLAAIWLITDKLADVENFQPAHDCVACRAENDQAAAFLRENPDRYVALANLSYTEVWES